MKLSLSVITAMMMVTLVACASPPSAVTNSTTSQTTSQPTSAATLVALTQSVATVTVPDSATAQVTTADVTQAPATVQPTVLAQPTAVVAQPSQAAQTPAVTANPAGRFGQEILFLRKGTLMAFDTNTRQERKVVDGVQDFVVAADGVTIALVRNQETNIDLWSVRRD